MSVTLYDKSLLNKIKNWVKDERMKITGPNETRRLFEYIADATNDKPIELPLIALRRDPTVQILSTTKTPLSFDGWRKDAEVTLDNAKGNQLNAIPIQVGYQIDIYTKYAEEAEEYIRNFVFNIINYPKLQIEIPYNDCNLMHNSYIRLSADINDNSDIPERLIPGQFTRKTLQVYIDDAYLFDFRIKDIVLVEPTIKVVLETETELDE